MTGRSNVIRDLLPSTPEWMLSAACAQVDPELFYPTEKGGRSQVRQARYVCRRQCKVQQECLTYALDHGENLWGVWGGTTPEERRRLKRRAA